MRYTTKVTLSSQATLGNFGRVWTSDVKGDHHVSFTIHLALRFNLSCGLMSCHSCGIMLCDLLIPTFSIDPLSATAQLCSYWVYPMSDVTITTWYLHKGNPSNTYQLILCFQLHNCAVLRSLLKLYAILVIPALPRLAQIPMPVKQW